MGLKLRVGIERRVILILVWLCWVGGILGFAFHGHAQETPSIAQDETVFYTDDAGHTQRVRVLKDVGEEVVIIDAEGEVRSVSRTALDAEPTDTFPTADQEPSDANAAWETIAFERELVVGKPTPETIQARRHMYTKERLPGYGRMVAGSTILTGWSLLAVPVLMPVMGNEAFTPASRAIFATAYLLPAVLATTFMVSGITKMQRTQERIENDAMWNPDIDRWLDQQGRALRTSGTIVMLVGAGVLYSSLVFGLDAGRGHFAGKPLRLTVAGTLILGAGASMVGFANRRRRATHADFTRRSQWTLAPGFHRGGGHLTFVMNL